MQSFRHAIVVCHPEPASFTRSLADRYADRVREHGHEVVMRDLYRMGFDPVLKATERDGEPEPDVRREWEVLGTPDVYVLAYPIWFGTPPAMMKGYIDRVFGAGRRRGSSPDRHSASERMADRRLVSLTSSGSRRSWLSEKGVLESMRTVYDRYFADVFGFRETHRYHFDGITTEISEGEIQAHLRVLEAAVDRIVRRMAGGPPDRDPNRP